MKVFSYVLKGLLTLLVVLGITAYLSYRPLPEMPPRSASEALPASENTALGASLLPILQEQNDLSAVYPLQDGREAFLVRLALVRIAEQSLDLQYYIWHEDVSGRLLLEEVYRAAERGVRVRLLLDDNNTGGMDEILAALNAHPNLELRLFNPFMQRRFRPLGYLNDFSRLNRRMHNKSLTADGLATVIGGRNIGDEYFEVGQGVMFADFDVVALGKAAQDVGQDFDRYWNSASAYPAEIILSAPESAFMLQSHQDAATQDYLRDLEALPFLQQLKNGQLPLLWAKAELFSDDPAKALGQANMNQTVVAKIAPVMASTQKELLLISPYFVAGKVGSAQLSALAKNGKKVSVLTNALAATDVLPVHAGYAKYRKALLEAGVRLFELKPHATVHSAGLRYGSSGASLHAKTFTVDGEKIFVGSFNLDPRSALLNTEMGLLLHSPDLASKVNQAVGENPLQYAYQVFLTNQQLHWNTLEQDKMMKYENEPHSHLGQRLGVWFFSLLPIEHLL